MPLLPSRANAPLIPFPFPFQYERIEICKIRKQPLRHGDCRVAALLAMTTSVAIHVRALSTMDRHGLRPRDDDAGPQDKAA